VRKRLASYLGQKHPFRMTRRNLAGPRRPIARWTPDPRSFVATLVLPRPGARTRATRLRCEGSAGGDRLTYQIKEGVIVLCVNCSHDILRNA